MPDRSVMEVRYNYDLSAKVMNLMKADYSFCGVFSLRTWKQGDIGYLFKLSSFDQIEYKYPIKALKSRQEIFRYETRAMLGFQRIITMIDFSLKQPRLYFLTKRANEEDFCEFEKAGITFNWIDLNFERP